MLPLHFLFNTILTLILVPFPFLIFCLFIFRETGRREGEKHQCMVASCAPPTGDLACNPGICSKWNQIRNPLVLVPTLNPLSYSSCT